MKIIPYILMIIILSGLVIYNQITPYMYLEEGLDTVYVGTSYEDPGATIRIGNTTYEMITYNEIDTDTIGKHSIVYEYEYKETIYRITRYVMVIPYDNFTMILNPGVDTIQIGDQWIDAGVQTSHEVDIEVVSNLNRLRAGTYEITYRVMYLEEVYEVIRYVTVVAS
jgi:hypothetical protein